MAEPPSVRDEREFRAFVEEQPLAWTMPSQPALVGLFLGTRDEPGAPTRTLRDDERLWEAWWRDELSLGDTVRAGRRTATVGRLLAASLLTAGVRDEALTTAWTHASVECWLREVARSTHVEVAARCAGALERLGDAWLARSGASWGIDDLAPPAAKAEALTEAWQKIAKVTAAYEEGTITEGERYNVAVEAWTAAVDRVGEATRETGRGGAWEAFSQTARGAAAERRRVCAMVGQVKTLWGEVIERCVTRGFGEGVDPHGMFLHARQRRLDEVTDRERFGELGEFSTELRRALGAVRVVSRDCGTTRGVTLRDPADAEVLALPLYERALGRVLAADIVTAGGEVLARAGEVVGPRHRAVWERVDEVSIRSLATCDESEGVCARCYGLDPDEGTVVLPGDPVGLRAAWGLSSPFARLPRQWRYFRIFGGSPSGWSRRTAPMGGVVSVPRGLFAKGRAVRAGTIRLAGADGATAAVLVREGDLSCVADGDRVERGAGLVQMARAWGRVRVAAIPEGVKAVLTLGPEVPPEAVVRIAGKHGAPDAWVLCGGERRERIRLVLRAVEPDDGRAWTIPLDPGQWLQTPLGSLVERGDTIAMSGWVHARFGDVDSTLREVRDHLDLARADVSTHSPCDGEVVRLDPGWVVVRSFAGREYWLRGRRPAIAVRLGSVVVRGEPITYGATSLRRLLRVVGEEAVAALIAEAFEHHAAWGKVPFARVHAELLARAMLSWRRVRRPGDTGLKRNAVVSRAECERAQREAVARGGRPAEVVPVVQGIGRIVGRRWMLAHRDRAARRGEE